MTEWREKKLENVFYIAKDTFKPSEEQQYKYIGLEHIEQNSLRINGWGYSNTVQSNKYFFQKDDVLFGKLRPYFRKVIKAPFDGVCSTDIWVCRVKKGFDQNFLFYFLANQEFVDTANSTDEGTRMPRADWSYLKNIIWNLPPLPEQKAIAEVLSSLDDKIDLLTRQNKTLEDLAQAYFRKWFIEDASEDWEVGKLGDIIETIESGSRPKGGIDPELKFGVPSIGAENINGIGNYDYSKTKFIPEKFFLSMKKGIVKNYDVLIYKDGAYVGKKSMFGNGFPYDKCAINEHVFILRTNKKANQFYLYFLLEEDELAQLNTNSAQPGLNKKSLLSMPITIPPIELVCKFESYAKSIFDKILSNSEQVFILSQLRDTLLPKLISGEIRVKM